MRNINRRVNNIEKRLNLGRNKESTLPPIILSVLGENSITKDKDIGKLGPKETWITYQKQLRAGEKANTEYLKDNPGGLLEII